MRKPPTLHHRLSVRTSPPALMLMKSMESKSLTERPSLRQVMLGILRPMSSDHALDPFSVKILSKVSPFRLAWTLQNRVLEFAARRSVSAKLPIEEGELVLVKKHRGSARIDTSVTTVQLELLLAALSETRRSGAHIVEVGSYRAATTVELARNTNSKVYAVDPFSGYGGSEEDFRRFQSNVEGWRNVIHLRETSGAASKGFEDFSIDFVFIDGVHDFSNSWFDFCAWSPKIVPGGLIAFHDVDDHPGARFAARRVIKKFPKYKVWAYCPNLLIIRKEK